MKRKPPLRGEVWLLDLNPIRGHEQAGRRPALVVSADLFNKSPAGLVVVLPLTTTHRNIPMHVPLSRPEGGVKQVSFILCDQVRCVSTDRLIARWGSISARTMSQVADRLLILLDLPAPSR